MFTSMSSALQVCGYGLRTLQLSHNLDEIEVRITKPKGGPAGKKRNGTKYCTANAHASIKQL